MTRKGADVCLVLEGTYPYVSGGVSTWVHQMLEAMPELEFALYYIGGQKADAASPQYDVPDNVVSLDEVYLFDGLPQTDLAASKRGPSLRGAVYRALGELLELVGSEGELEAFLELVNALYRSGRGMAFANLWSDREAWELLHRTYDKSMSGEPFLQFFWTARFLTQPLWKLARAIDKAPRATVYHSLCTGYAGVAAALMASRAGGRFLLSEHGIYLRERIADIQRARWIDDVPSRYPGVFENLSAYRRLWIDYFSLLGRISYRAADWITTLFTRNAEIQQSFGADRSRIEVIPNGVKLPNMETVATARAARGAASKNVGFLGRVVSIKDVKTLLRAARLVADQVPEVQFLLAGSTTEEPGYYDACKALREHLDLGDTVQFLGPQERDPLLARCDVMLLTSISEGLPFVVLESFAAGIPVVATDVGSCRELLLGKPGEDPAFGPAGMVTPVAEPVATANALVRLLDNSELRRRMGDAGRSRAEAHFKQEDVVDRYRQLYRGEGASH